MPLSLASSLSDLAGMIQPCGALLVLTADLAQVLQASDNLAEVAGVSADAALEHGPAQVLGNALWQRLCREMQGRARLPAAVVMSRRVAGGVRRLQVDLHRQGERVFVEIEPLQTSSNKRRLLATVSGWLAQLAAADHPDLLLEILVEGVQSITGHDRVLVASFDAEGHGAVVAESVVAKVPSLMGMRFPASDFPPQMRELFERQAVRSLPDVEAVSVPLRPCRDPLTGEVVDLSPTLLRGLSSAQRHYLRGMQVRAVLTVALQGDAGLWGLLICHGLAAHPISPLARDAVASLVQMTTQRLFLLKARREAATSRRCVTAESCWGGRRRSCPSRSSCWIATAASGERCSVPRAWRWSCPACTGARARCRLTNRWSGWWPGSMTSTATRAPGPLMPWPRRRWPGGWIWGRPAA